jgi:uncharacterized membrane protein YdjX (TVP38/TMEM64 family)
MSKTVRSVLAGSARLGALAAPIALGLLAGQALRPWLPQFTAYVGTLGNWAPLVYVVAYVVVVVFMLPAFLLIMAGGAVFGATKGTLLAMMGALLGGTLAFLLSRHVGREKVAERIARHPTLSMIDRSIGDEGAKLIFLLRLSPAIPFVLSNYALGVTGVRLRHFLVGTMGFFPVVATYAAFGSASGTLTAGGAAPVSPTVLGMGMIATIALGVMMTRITQQAMRNASISDTSEFQTSAG